METFGHPKTGVNCFRRKQVLGKSNFTFERKDENARINTSAIYFKNSVVYMDRLRSIILNIRDSMR